MTENDTDGRSERKYTEAELREEIVDLATEYNDHGLAWFAVDQMMEDARKRFRSKQSGADQGGPNGR